jgi:hypothetical protein
MILKDLKQGKENVDSNLKEMLTKRKNVMNGLPENNNME